MDTTLCLYVCPLMDTWVAPTFWLLWILLLWTWVYHFLLRIVQSSFIPITVRLFWLHRVLICTSSQLILLFNTSLHPGLRDWGNRKAAGDRVRVRGSQGWARTRNPNMLFTAIISMDWESSLGNFYEHYYNMIIFHFLASELVFIRS